MPWFFLIFRLGSIIVFLRYYACWEGFTMADAKAKTINLLLYEGDLEGVTIFDEKIVVEMKSGLQIEVEE